MAWYLLGILLGNAYLEFGLARPPGSRLSPFPAIRVRVRTWGVWDWSKLVNPPYRDDYLVGLPNGPTVIDLTVGGMAFPPMNAHWAW